MYGVVSVLFVLYVVVDYYAPKPLNWAVTFSDKDKNPYGGYVLYDRLGDVFNGHKSLSFETLYEMRGKEGSVVILADQFKPSMPDLGALKAGLDSGRSYFIAAHSFSREFLDTLALNSGRSYEPLGAVSSDSSALMANGDTVYCPVTLLDAYFEPDSLEGWEVLARTDRPVAIRKGIGRGTLVLATVPLVFSNYGLLYDPGNYRMASFLLQHLPDGDVVYDRFYQTGKPRASTPLRYFLSQAPLRWFVYLTVLGLLLLLVVGSQRTQRAIPVWEAPQNTTLEFVRTIGGLYHQEANHKNVADKMITYFLNSLTENYYVRDFANDKTLGQLAAKTGLDIREIVRTFDLIRHIRQATTISEETLNQLYQHISNFKLQQKQ